MRSLALPRRLRLVFRPSTLTSPVRRFHPAGSLSGFVLPSNYTGPLPGGAIKSNTRGLWSTPHTDFSPRIGFSLKLSNRYQLLLRAGYGIYYNRMSGDLAETTVGQPPYSFKQSLAGAANAGSTLQQPYVPSSTCRRQLPYLSSPCSEWSTFSCCRLASVEGRLHTAVQPEYSIWTWARNALRSWICRLRIDAPYRGARVQSSASGKPAESRQWGHHQYIAKCRSASSFPGNCFRFIHRPDPRSVPRITRSRQASRTGSAMVCNFLAAIRGRRNSTSPVTLALFPTSSSASSPTIKPIRGRHEGWVTLIVQAVA